jgi:hypothetical protein
MNNIMLACRIRPDYFAGAAPLHLTINLNGQPIFSQLITDVVDFSHELSDDPGPHCLEFVMSGKTFGHSVLDSSGTILSDCLLHIDHMLFDDIELDNIFRTHSRYTHSYNDPKQEAVSQDFHGTLGCNGQVVFEFETPMYLWLLENM